MTSHDSTANRPEWTRARHRPATIQDVADRAGVSRAAVSKVIRDAYGVSDRMRERVETAIAELDYRPRVAARAMRGSSYTLGLEIPQLGNDFHSMVVAGATDVLATTPYQLIIAPIRDPFEGDKALRSLADRQVDGDDAIAPLVSADWLSRYAELLPVVMVGRHDRSDHYHTLTGDDAHGAEQNMRHRVDLSHRRIAFLDAHHRRPRAHKSHISATDRDPPAIRRRVYHELMNARGLSPRVVVSPGHLEEDAAEAAHALLDEKSRPSAIFAAHDTLAIGALHALTSLRLDARDVSVVG